MIELWKRHRHTSNLIGKAQSANRHRQFLEVERKLHFNRPCDDPCHCCGQSERRCGEDDHQRVNRALRPVVASSRFEVVVIDCPPSLGVLTLNAFAAADSLLVPLQCEYYALEGISMMTRLLNQLRDSGVNPKLELLGVVMTMFDGRTNLSHQVVSEVRQHFGDTVFETVIPRTTRLAEAPSFGKPIIYYDKYSAGAAAYEVLTQDLLKRLKL